MDIEEFLDYLLLENYKHFLFYFSLDIHLNEFHSIITLILDKNIRFILYLIYV